MYDYDVVIYDNIGAPFTPAKFENEGSGGSEYALHQLATELAKFGLKILVANRTDEIIEVETQERTKKDIVRGFVRYANVVEAENKSCRALVVSRCSEPPKTIRTERMIIAATDNPGHAYDNLLPYMTSGMATVACVSRWQAKLFPWAKNRLVIEPMIDDFAYNLSSAKVGFPKKQGQFVYASAAMKGLIPTLQVWSSMGAPGELCVTTPGYDEPPADIEQIPGVRWMGVLPPRDMIRLLAESEGLFYVNTMPETFCVIAALAEILRVRNHILCLASPGALKEVLANPSMVSTTVPEFMEKFNDARADRYNPKWYAEAVKDRRPQKMIGQWRELLGV